MKPNVISLLVGLFSWHHVVGHEYDFVSHDYENRTEPATRQLYDFRKAHLRPIGLLTTSAGLPVSLKKTNALNSDPLFNTYLTDTLFHFIAEKLPERVTTARGTVAHGYFEVTDDVSKYTKAEVFNGVGKKTPVLARFTTVLQHRGGADAGREPKGMSVKFYTQEGNLDLMGLNLPMFFIKDPLLFPSLARSTMRNARTNFFDTIARNDFYSLRFETINALLRLASDCGLPNGYRKMDVFPIHTYEIYNAHGKKYYVKFNFRTLQGIENLPTAEALIINGIDPDYYNRDMYNAIAKKHFPMWRLDMDILTMDDLLHLDLNPFDVTREWEKGTYKTVTIGKIVLDKNPDNFNRVNEQAAFNPVNLVPGISGPKDKLYRGRALTYSLAHSHRLGVNINKIDVNRPFHAKNYLRDGVPPVLDNMKDAPNYYPNTFSGPISYVDATYPKEQILVFESNAVDLQEAAYYYNHIVQTDDERDRIAVNIVLFALLEAPPFLQKRFLKLLSFVDHDLENRADINLKALLAAPPPPPPRVLIPLNHSVEIHDDGKVSDHHE